MKQFRDILKWSKFQKEVFLLINMFFLSWWETWDIWMKVNTKFSNLYMVVLSPWHRLRRLKLFTLDVRLRNAIRGLKLEKELRKVKYLLNIWSWSTRSMKNGLRPILHKMCWSLTQLRTLKIIQKWFKTCLEDSNSLWITDIRSFIILICYKQYTYTNI